jgi:hypothetical protein
LWIKSKGFNAIRVIQNPLPEDFYRICDEIGLLCFQDLPINLFSRPGDSEEAFLDNWNSYYNHLGRLANQFSSISAVGINFQSDAASEKHLDLLNNFQSTAKKLTIPIYISSLNHHPGLNDIPDFQIIEIFRRSELLKRLDFFRLNYPDYVIFPSGYTKAVSYRVDSTKFNGDLYEISKFYEKARAEFEAEELFGQFTTTYSDFFLQFPSNQNNINGDPSLNKTGLVDLTRQSRQFAGITNEISVTKTLKAQEQNSQSYLYIVFGLLNLFLFLFFYRQLLEFRLNIHYSLKKAHGFFVNLQERIQIPNGQSFLLLFVVSVNGAIILSAFTYYYRNNLFLDYLISLIFFTPELKLWIIKTIWNPLAFLVFGTLFGFLVFLLFAVVLKLFSLFGKSNVQIRQAIAVSAWSAVPIVLLTPLAIVFYNILATFESYWIMLIVLLYFYFWFYVRWINGTRVLADKLFLRTFMLLSLFFLGCTAIVLYYFQHKINIIEHLQFLYHLYSS